MIKVNDNIHLSDFATTDRDRMVELLETKEVYPTTLSIPYPYTLEDADTWIARANPSGCFAIRSDGGVLMGSISIGGYGKPLTEDFKAILGYWLGKPYWNQGIMTAVVGAVVKYGFDTYPNLMKVGATCFASNVGSARVLEKNGFACEGEFRQHYLKDGAYCDGLSYGLLREDWMVSR